MTFSGLDTLVDASSGPGFEVEPNVVSSRVLSDCLGCRFFGRFNLCLDDCD